MVTSVKTLLIQEKSRALAKHGRLTRDPVRASAILSEEAGEVSGAALTLTRPGGGLEANREQLKSELAQVAAVVGLWLEDLQDEDDQFKEGNIK